MDVTAADAVAFSARIPRHPPRPSRPTKEKENKETKNIGMFPLILAVLNWESRAPFLSSLLRAVSL